MTQREEVSTSLWRSDEADSGLRPHFEEPYFDQRLDAWVVSRYEDVLAACRLPCLSIDSKRPTTDEDERVLRRLREETLGALSAAQLQAWSDELAPLVCERVNALPESSRVDLLKDYLHPLCLRLAALVTSIDAKDAALLQETAFTISAAASEPLDPTLRSAAKAVTPRFREHFHSDVETLRDSGFVALSWTLPSMLGNSYYALLKDPRHWSLLHGHPKILEQAMEELNRHAGLVRSVRRQALEDLTLGGAKIRRGDRVILRIMAANHDGARFSSPDRLDLRRREAGHLSLGAGTHACAGAGLIRMAAVLLTRPLIASFASASLIEPIEWRGGSGFRTPKALPVVLRRS